MQTITLNEIVLEADFERFKHEVKVLGGKFITSAPIAIGYAVELEFPLVPTV